MAAQIARFGTRLKEILGSVGSGLAGFATAWIAPVALAVVVYWLVMLDGTTLFTDSGEAGVTLTLLLQTGAGLSLVVFVTAGVLAYASLPIYRVLEGYVGPRRLREWLRKRSVMEWRRLQRVAEVHRRTGRVTNTQDLDRVLEYPHTAADVLPTRLGNALLAMESYGRTRYGLDSQRMWYELLAAVPGEAVANVDQARRSVDFFVGGIASLTLLFLTTGITLIIEPDRVLGGTLLAVAAVVLIPLAYRGAVVNMVDWSHAVKALVNVGRVPLAEMMWLKPESTELRSERAMWNAHDWAVERLDTEQIGNLNYVRRWPEVRRRVHPG